ncbi:hypothetical protein [Clostridium sp. BJN0013]|uniref:hypothetical protein n=1 Tax=Clostridium sp. BJN0013 TaxID=3236840 RepID=UPI0034C63C96
MKFDLDNSKRKLKETAIRTGFQIINKNPEKDVNKLFELAEKTSRDEFTKSKIISIKKYYNEMPSVKEYIENILKNTNWCFSGGIK